MKDGQSWDLEAGLKAAFGRPPATGRESVMTSLSRYLGRHPKILLREDDAPSGLPLRSLGPDLKASLPQGRGNYQVLGELARGGMGVVLKGHDDDLGRDVAMKVLHREFCQRPDSVQRFVEEAQIGGQLQHPGIVPVYELGLMADERPYFTMKLVKGSTLASLFAKRDATPGERSRFLALFEQVCQTMAYAHSRGVIHRDLKPSNVMIGPFGEVQVVDWGLAKVLAGGSPTPEAPAAADLSKVTVLETVRSGDGSSHSRAGSVMGTPAYMAPEQARGEVAKVDERADVFSLGAILCEILTGQPPYVGEQDQVLGMAANAELDDANARLAACGADAALVQLAHKCLAPAPSARPRDAGVVASAIHAHLAAVEERTHRAEVEAAAARVKARAERRARRLTLVASTTILLILLASGAGYLGARQREQVRRDRLAESIQTARYDANEHRSRGDLEAALAAVEQAALLSDQGGAPALLVARIDEQRQSLEEEQATRRAQEEREARNAALLARLEAVGSLEQQAFSASGDSVGAQELLASGDGNDRWPVQDLAYRDAFSDYGIELEGTGDADLVERLRASGIPSQISVCLDDWARILRRLARADEARRLVRIAQLADDDDWRNRMRTAVLAEDAPALLELAESARDEGLPPLSLMLLSQSLRGVGEHAGAIALMEDAILAHPGSWLLRLELGRTLGSGKVKSYARALRHYEAALALRPDSSLVLGNMSFVLREMGRYEEAVERAIQGLERNPVDNRCRHQLAWAYWYSDGIDRALEVIEEAKRRTPTAEPDSWEVHAWMLVQGARYDEAVPRAREAVRRSPECDRCHLVLAYALWGSGKWDEAFSEYQVAARLDEVNVFHYVVALRRAGRHDEEIQILEAGVAGGWPWVLALAKAHERAGNVERAIELLQEDLRTKPIELLQEDLRTKPEDLDALYQVGSTLVVTGRVEEGTAGILNDLAWKLVVDPSADLFDPAEGVELAERAIALVEDQPYIWNTYGTALYRAGRYVEAINACRKSLALSAAGEESAEDSYVIAMAHHQLGNAEEARRAYEQARALHAKASSEDADLERLAVEAKALLGMDD